MKIYTKTGDLGETSLFGGKRVKKFDLRIDAYGTSDELNSWIGLIRDQEINSEYKKSLIEIQDRIFTLGAQLAADPEKRKLKMPKIGKVMIVEVMLVILIITIPLLSLLLLLPMSTKHLHRM